MPFRVSTGRFNSAGRSPGTFAMTPHRNVKNMARAGLKDKLAVSMGVFYGPKQAKQWSADLKQRDEVRGRTPGAHDRRIQELNTRDAVNHQHNVTRHADRLKEERDRHIGGYGQLGAADDRLSCTASALAGDVTSNTPRFLETFPTVPKQPAEEELRLRASTNPMLLGKMPLEPVKGDHRGLNYDPINHK